MHRAEREMVNSLRLFRTRVVFSLYRHAHAMTPRANQLQFLSLALSRSSLVPFARTRSDRGAAARRSGQAELDMFKLTFRIGTI